MVYIIKDLNKKKEHDKFIEANYEAVRNVKEFMDGAEKELRRSYDEIVKRSKEKKLLRAREREEIEKLITSYEEADISKFKPAQGSSDDVSKIAREYKEQTVNMGVYTPDGKRVK